MCVRNRICRFDVIICHMTKRNITTLTNETADPTDEMNDISCCVGVWIACISSWYSG